MKKAFESLSPIICFVFYLIAICFGMVIINPYYEIVAVIFSITMALRYQGRKALKYILCLLPIALIIAALNPIFNTYGENVLMIIFNRKYTMEALIYGINIGLMFISIMSWFISFNHIMTSDKLIYLFGRIIPSISLMLTMILRLVPNLKKKASSINMAREAIGKGVNLSSRKEGIKNGALTLSALTSMALEDGIKTSESMNARGYGVGKRTTFRIYRMSLKDWILLSFLVVTASILIYASVNGGTSYIYYNLTLAKGKYFIIGILAYSILLGMPTLLDGWEEIKWYNLKSKI